MSLTNEVKGILSELINNDDGWAQLLALHGWTFDVSAMSEAEFEDKLLNHPLTVDRSIAGFQDFASDSSRMIVPGRPSRSLLYHALASPNVVEHVNHTLLVVYPTLKQIDLVENLVYALRRVGIAEIAANARQLLGLSPTQSLPIAVAVYSSEYRPASETPHRTHADLCLARTGIARVGNTESHYVPRMRGFQVFLDGDDDHAIRVLPCRYSAYLAIQTRGRRDRFGPVFSGSAANQDASLDFWVPVHKLFNGSECLTGLDLTVEFESQHFNQKIAKLVGRLKDRGFSNVPDDRLDEPDYVFSDRIAELLPDDAILGPGMLAPPHQALVEEATHQGNSISFQTPPMGTPGFSNAFSPTLSVDAETSPPIRSWPEYAHVRQRTDVTPPQDINLEANVVAIANAGGFDAQHYKDFAGDGWVTATVTDPTMGRLQNEGGDELPSKSAYSLVTAPDFYPNVSQRRIYEWWRATNAAAANGELPDWWTSMVTDGTWGNFWRRSPEPLSDERHAANFPLPDSPFDAADRTTTGVITTLQEIDLSLPQIATPTATRHSFLPDHAAGAFAPGWDASVDRTTGVDHFTAYGLGSPFPEDAKLCAALSTFWPAAAPDITRTFFTVPFSNGSVCPMTDDELGVTGDQVAWDGITGPMIVGQTQNAVTIEYPDYPHVDYTRAALNNQFSIRKTSRVSVIEYQRRILATLRCYRAMGPQTPGNVREASHLFSFRVADAMSELDEAQAATGQTLNGPIYRFELFTDQVQTTTGVLDNVSAPTFINDNRQIQFNVQFTWTVFVGSGQFVLLRWRRGDGSAATGNWISVDV